jgi:LemA protein
MLTGLIILGIVVVIASYAAISYNMFMGLQNRVDEAFATMDVYLKKRWDLIPNIVETVKGYAEHEKSTLENVIKMRNTAYEGMSTEEKIENGNALTGALSKLFALAESYPELKANQNFMQLSGELSRIEEDIANSRKYFNAVVRKLNNSVEMFPSNIIAGIFGIKAMKMFETKSEERENVKVEF